MQFSYTSYSLSDAERSNRVVAITFSVVSSNPNKYVNRKISPNRTFYGYATYLNGDYVCGESELQFDKQLIYFWNSPEPQLASELYEKEYATATSIKALDTILAPAVKLGALQLVTPAPRQVIACPIDRFIISVAADCIYNVSVQTEPVDSGDLESVQYRVLQLN